MMLAEYYGGPGDGQRRAVAAGMDGPAAVIGVIESAGVRLACPEVDWPGRRGSYLLEREPGGAPRVDAAGRLVYRWGGWSDS